MFRFLTVSLLSLVVVQFSTACSSGEAVVPGPTSGSGSSGGLQQGTGGGDLGSGGSGTGTGGTVGSATGGASTGDPLVDAEPTAAIAAAEMGKGFNLGQMFENTQHPRTLAAASAKIDAYYEQGFRNVRIPVTWTEDVGGDTLVGDPTVGDVNREHPRLAVIKEVVDYALRKPGLYVVINAHHEHALKDESRSSVLQRLWKDITDIFNTRDHRLLFEILNEPHKTDETAMPAADLRAMTALAYQEIRAVDTKRIVIIGGNQWFGAQEVPAVWTSLDGVGGGDDPYVMATFHHYNPWTFCGSDQGSYDDAWTTSDQSGPMATMANWAQTTGKGMPVYIGEWGVGWGSRYTTMTCNNIRAWYTSFDSQYAKEKGQPTAVWDDGGWFKIFDHQSGQFSNNLIDCINGACDWDGTDQLNDGCD